MFGLKSILVAQSMMLLAAAPALAGPTAPEGAEAQPTATELAAGATVGTATTAAAAAAAARAAEEAKLAQQAAEAAQAIEASKAAAAKTSEASQAAAATSAAPAKAGATATAEAEVCTATMERDGLCETSSPKAWRVSAALNQSLGQGTFVKDSYAAAPLYSYGLSLSGTYKVHPKISVGARADMDQVLTTSNLPTGGTYPREFFFRDIILSASAPEIYKESFTGLKVGAGLGFNLPTSKASQAQELVTVLRGNLNLSRVFEGVGPGNLTLAYSLAYRHYVGPEARVWPTGLSSDRTCRSVNRNESGECLTSFANPRDVVANSLAVTYEFLDDFSFTASYALVDVIAARTNDSPLPASLTGTANPVVGRSPYASDASAVTALTNTAIELGYSINKYLSLALGLSTAQSPYIQDGSNSKRLRFPFWDFESTAESLSSFYLTVAATY